MAKPVVAEVAHHIKYVDYAQRILQERVLDHLNRIPNPSVGVEISPMLIEKIRKAGKGSPSYEELSGQLKFWKEIVDTCDTHKIRVVPLVDEKVRELVDAFDLMGTVIINQKVASGKISGAKLEKLGITSRNRVELTFPMVWKMLSGQERDRITLAAGKMIVETDRQLGTNIPSENPTISFVGQSHGDRLGGLAEVLPYPGEEHPEVKFLRAARTAFPKVRERMIARQRSMGVKGGTPKDRKKKRKKKPPGSRRRK